MDIQFTARMEDELDEVEEGKIGWATVLGEFYRDFRQVSDDQVRELLA